MAWLSENLLSIQAIINHDEFLTEFARTIGDMANVLPKTNFLCELYPTKQMEDGIAHVYSKIIDFVLEAVKWYKKSKLQHALSLYSVTCGDIGTEATTVQKYLDTILYLAKIWDCDEADVFLEERSVSDLQRNSLVSVFLRVLEYYEGIIILTSNRVGIFDEASQSRIRVALPYEPLTVQSRKAIWRNFFDMLGDDDEESRVNIRGLDSRLEELAGYEINGRQIRNVLLTARQLALHRKESLEWKHLSQVLILSDNFGEYLKRIRGVDDERWARQQSIR